jgi:hypothetical protein
MKESLQSLQCIPVISYNNSYSYIVFIGNRTNVCNPSPARMRDATLFA